MIVSHKHRFIFLKTKKTAGTSIELALSAVCGRDDIITPLAQPEDEPLRRGLAPQNWRRPGLVPAAWRGMAELFDLSRKAVDFHEHIKAEKARRFLGERVWNSYFKFAVERNPWDRQVSYWQFKMRKLGAKPMTLAEFLETHHANLNSANIYSLDGRLAVDHLVRYEHLAGDLDHVLSHLGIDARLDLPKAKGEYRRVGDYRDQYDAATRNWVARTYATEIALCGYRFDDPEPLLLDGRIRPRALAA
jgi:Sulfotransferase family